MKDKVNEMRKEILSKLIKKTVEPKAKGGQSCGIMSPVVSLESKELGIKIEVGYCKSQLQNLDIAMRTMRSLIVELIK